MGILKTCVYSNAVHERSLINKNDYSGNIYVNCLIRPSINTVLVDINVLSPISNAVYCLIELYLHWTMTHIDNIII